MTFAGGTSMLFKDMEIRNSLVVDYMQEIQDEYLIENSTIVDGGLTDRYNEFDH